MVVFSPTWYELRMDKLKIRFSQKDVVLLFALILLVSVFVFYPSGLFIQDKGLSPQGQEFKILFVGDVMFGRHVETLMESNGPDYPFQKIKEFLKGYNFVVANLEGAITKDHAKSPDQSFKFSFPPESGRVLRDNNITLLSIANNHALDYGDRGFTETKKYLAESGINYFGHPVGSPRNYVFQKKFGERNVIFLGFNSTYPSFHIEEAEKLVKSFTLDEESFVIVYMHWGDEYKKLSNSSQRAITHSLIDSGADLVLGSHPHVVQEIESYKDKLIFYSLGNFVFDQYFSKDTQEGLAVELIFRDKKETYKIYPIESIKSQPDLMEEKLAEEFLSDLAMRSFPKLREGIKAGIISINDNK